MKQCPVCAAEYPDDVRFCASDGTALRGGSGPDAIVGQVLADRYHVLRLLGAGGMGEVYLAEHVRMGRQSAIKILSRSLAADAEAVSRFNREASNASRISHPNVCAVYDFGETPDGLVYLAMEYVEGRALGDLLDQGPLPLTRAADIVAQTADALHAAHELGIVHRDLKPDNIMVAEARGRDLVKVVDFGIAKAMGARPDQKVTRTGLVVGTPEYMSPEQLVGDELDGRSDLYSLGLVFYRSITGVLPFGAGSAQETLFRRLTDDPATLAAVRPDLTFPPELQPLFDRALARRREDRFADAAEFARAVRALDGVAAPAPVAPPAIRPAPAGHTVPTTVVSSAPRRRGALGWVVGGAVLVAGAAVAYSFLPRPAGRSPASGAPAAATDSATEARPVAPTRETRSPGRAPDRAGRPAIDSAALHRPPVRIAGADASVTLPDVDAVYDPARRDAARRQAAAIYERSDVSDSVRAVAASTVAAVYQQEQDLASALAWARRAAGLRPREYGGLVTSLEAAKP